VSDAGLYRLKQRGWRPNPGTLSQGAAGITGTRLTPSQTGGGEWADSSSIFLNAAMSAFRPRRTGRFRPIADIHARCMPTAMSAAQPIEWSRSLQELDGVDWGDSETAETPMVGRVLALRRKPLADLTNGEVRLAVSQKVALPWVLELAIERLRADPLLEGDYYPGDLLSALVRLEDEEWGGRADLRADLEELFRQAMEQTGDDADAFREGLELPPSGRKAN
jgi:hypothetical protein